MLQAAWKTTATALEATVVLHKYGLQQVAVIEDFPTDLVDLIICLQLNICQVGRTQSLYPDTVGAMKELQSRKLYTFKPQIHHSRLREIMLGCEIQTDQFLVPLPTVKGSYVVRYECAALVVPDNIQMQLL